MKVNKTWIRKTWLPELRHKLKEYFLNKRSDVAEQIVQNRDQFLFFSTPFKTLYDRRTQDGCLWLIDESEQVLAEEVDQAFTDIKERFSRTHGATIPLDWELPAFDDLNSALYRESFASLAGLEDDDYIWTNEMNRLDEGARLARTAGNKNKVWLKNKKGKIISLAKVAKDFTPINLILDYGFIPDKGEGIQGVYRRLYDDLQKFLRIGEPDCGQDAPSEELAALLLELDHEQINLPKLEKTFLHDTEKGFWELHWPEGSGSDAYTLISLDQPLEARSPERDLRSGVVAIDFGTSNTVVAIREHGAIELLRVGMEDLFSQPDPCHYENPTVLEFRDFQNMLRVWRAEAHRPLVRWADLTSSHKALDSLRNNQGQAEVVASILTRLKQLPLRPAEAPPLRLTDQCKLHEFALDPIEERLPVKGEPASLAAVEPFDPIELYAYCLGLAINWRQRGIFLRYAMTFPVAYPREAKQRILASFTRGLLRSLPDTLTTSPRLAEFEVREVASEPSAYAACAFKELGLQPPPEGFAYAVFDFGGGTADFDFGVYRPASTEEDAAGYEFVMERFGASGDPWLGGEQLVDHLAWRVFRQNLDLCRKHRIVFTRPADAENFPGSEMLIDNSWYAATNMTLLGARLRPIWEQFGRKLDSEELSVKLLNREGNQVDVTLAVDQDALNRFLVERTHRGMTDFFLAMRRAYERRAVQPGQLHLLLAGNASRSGLVQALLRLMIEPTLPACGFTEGNDAGDCPLEAIYPLLLRLLKEFEEWTSAQESTPADLDRLIRTWIRAWNREANSETPCAENGEETKPGPAAPNPLYQALKKVLGDWPLPSMILHSPLAGDPASLFQPTGKTGVAIGLLSLLPGEPILLRNADMGRQAPFRHFVGRFSRGAFRPVLHQNDAYQDWRELGPAPDGVLILAHSTSLAAITGELRRGAAELRELAVPFHGELDGRKIFVRATGPDTVELAAAASLEALATGAAEISHRQVIPLGH